MNSTFLDRMEFWLCTIASIAVHPLSEQNASKAFSLHKDLDPRKPSNMNKIYQNSTVRYKRITSVRRVVYDEPQEVYDVTNLDGHESFALGCGVIVHNCRSARHPGFQEILPLKGKISNAMKKSEEQVLLDQEVIYTLSMIGFNPHKADPLEKIRVGKIIFLADPDPDGHHINSLLLALKFRYMPGLIDRGLVYVADTPEFFAETKNGFVFGNSVQDMGKKLKAAGYPNARINHVKGYGEFEVGPLRELVFAPETRRLIQLQPLTEKDKKVFNAIMGESVEGRKLLLGV